MPSRGLSILIAAALVLGATLTPLAQSENARRGSLFGAFHGLQPGEFVVHTQKIPVEIVLIGFGTRGVKSSDILPLLPDTYTPIVRYPQFYGLNGRDMGLSYAFEYSVTRQSSAFERQFFDFLARSGTEGPPTTFQLDYNAQVHNVVDVAGPVLYIDGPRVERWLETHDRPRDRGYTIYFINWYGRPGFRFHVYTKTDDPDPDTGYNFGKVRASRAMNSWGGSTGRTWFYDFSAGPEAWTGNWNVDDADVDGDGIGDYRMPPIWEYASNGYRAPSRLGADMGLLTRFVGINLLFTPSPLYDPMITAPGPGGRRVVDMTMFEDDPGSSGLDWVNARFAKDRWSRFQPYYRWKTALRDVKPIDPGAKNALDTYAQTNVTPGCWESIGVPDAQLFCYFAEHLGLYVPDYKPHDYVAPVFSFNTTDDNLGAQLGVLGFADDNWVDGTQSFVFAFDTDGDRELGFGFTGTAIHEVGHHIGLPHPHDGYDAELGFDYGPGGDLYFAWSGDESDTVMQYLSVTNEFGEHNRDNMYRWEMAGYLNWSNALVADILASPKAHKVALVLRTADLLAALAQNLFRQCNYLEAAASARGAYLALVNAADEIGVSSERLSAARRALPSELIERYVCRPRFMQEPGVARP
jgi:hypothetical protein